VLGVFHFCGQFQEPFPDLCDFRSSVIRTSKLSLGRSLVRLLSRESEVFVVDVMLVEN